MSLHEVFIKRCLELAQNGASSTRPNPMVGSVVVHNGKIIGEGWHYKSGKPHAEVHAIARVKDQSLLKESTIYVSLEPCSHHGKTPPCANLIIEKGIPEVVVACLDPNPAVAGNGVKRMQAAGISVTSGVLEKEALELNRKFITYHQKKRPYITLKWAQSADGVMDVDREKGQRGSFAISGQEARVFVHKLRAEHASILVGPDTAINDNPSLTVRDYSGLNPIRLILDRNGRVPGNHNLFTDGGETLHFVADDLAERGGKSVFVPREEFIPNMLQCVYNQGIQSILVEGGAGILNAFIAQDLWDEAFILIAPKNLGRGLKAPILNREAIANISIGNDKLNQYRNHGLFDH